MTRKLLSVACGAIVAGVLSFSQAGATTAITYNVNEGSTSTVGVTGVIQTDGTTGTLMPANITDWNLTLFLFGETFNLTGPLSGGGSSVLNLPLAPFALSATATSLNFNFASTAEQEFGISTPSFADDVIFVDSDTAMSPAGFGSSAPFIEVAITQNGTREAADISESATSGPIGTVSPTGTTPLPATLPLFATGLGALGLLGWRRKRRAHAV